MRSLKVSLSTGLVVLTMVFANSSIAAEPCSKETAAIKPAHAALMKAAKDTTRVPLKEEENLQLIVQKQQECLKKHYLERKSKVKMINPYPHRKK